MATTAMSAGDPMDAYPEQAASGGLLIDFLGNFVGLNYYDKEGTAFIPRSTVLEFVARFPKTYANNRIRSQKKTADNRKTVPWWGVQGREVNMPARFRPHIPSLEGSSRISGCHYCDPEGQSALGGRFKRFSCYHSRWPAIGDNVRKEAAKNRLRSRGYSFPAFEDLGMRLLCNFEEEFGEDIWSKLDKEVALEMSQSVVSLASFSGDKRFFACTGVVIGCNEFTTRVLTSASLIRNPDDEAKVADDLKIEVCLPDNQHATSTLQHYNLHYNIAVITHQRHGRDFDWQASELDCKELMMSTCRITKAGIGGPLVDCAGNFIGMDFYSLKETPYLPRSIILEVLKNFDAKPVATDLINDHKPNRWPVPKPCWCYPLWHEYLDEYIGLGKIPNMIPSGPQPM